MHRRLLCAALMAAFLLPGSGVAAGSASLRAGSDRATSHHPVGLIRRDNVKVYAQPSTRSRVLAVAVEQTQVEVVSHKGSWSHVSLWASVRGWVQSAEIVYRKPWASVSTYQAPEIHYHVHASPTRTLHAAAVTTAPVTMYSSLGGHALGTIPSGTPVSVTGWQQDANGAIWYRLRGVWVPGEAVQFKESDPGLERKDGRQLWKLASGKGMWLTLGTIAGSDPNTIIQAALHNGLTHLYLESAISPLGFHGKNAVGPLIDSAHRHHLAVIAWVFPYLYDIAGDIALTQQVAAYRTASGDRFDGIAADLERNVSLPTVRAYSQLVRAYLGRSYLLVGVTYPPQSFPTFPFAEVAHTYNLIAPMDYWHQTKTAYGLDYGHMPYGYTYGYQYAEDSVSAIRRLSGHVPVAPIGQVFDNFGRLEMGPYAPSAQEISGFLAGSRASGAIGASFFQWMTAQVDEWHAIHDFKY